MFFHITDVNTEKAKEEAEHFALEKIKIEFENFPALSEWIENYELKDDKESLFLYSLDKVLPVLNIFMDDGRSWRRDGVDLDMIEGKTKKISKDKFILSIWEDLLKDIKGKEDLFG